MGYRRKARECALQMLFQIEMTGDPETRVRRGYWATNVVPPAARSYADQLVSWTVADQERIDRQLREVVRRWRLERMARVDLAVLRLAVAEFLHSRETPRKVVINEAIEIARKYGTDDSPQFVNGVLDAVRRELEAVTPAQP